jgi:hypothetical protein
VTEVNVPYSVPTGSLAVAGAMDFKQLQDEVLAVHVDAATVPLHHIQRWLNDAQADLASRTRILTAEVTEANAAMVAGKIPIPGDYLDGISLRLGAGNDVEFVNNEVYHSYLDGGGTPSHSLGRVFGAFIELYPVPSSSSYVLRYVRLPAHLSNTGDIPEVPAHLHRRLIHYAQAQILYRLGEAALGDRYMGMYADGLPRSDLGRWRSRPGPLALVPVAGPFDTDDAAHF